MMMMLDQMKRVGLSIRSDRKAVTAMEYALIAALIAVVIVGALMTVGGQLGSTFNSVASGL